MLNNESVYSAQNALLLIRGESKCLKSNIFLQIGLVRNSETLKPV